MKNNRAVTNLSGLVLLNKPLGCSSNAALQKLKAILGVKKAGHTGSLDPKASGMLPICIGDATKFSQYLLNADKCYRAEIKLGYQSSTGDAEGDIHKVVDIIEPLAKQYILACLQSFQGEILQVPPMHSAIKYKGQPLYKLARRGVSIERQERKVCIHSIELLECSIDALVLKVSCSKGTYIRTLAEDIGKKLGTSAYLSGLHRLSVGHFEESQMHNFMQIQQNLNSGASMVLPIEQILGHFPSVTLAEEDSNRIINGQKINTASMDEPGLIRIYAKQFGFLGLGMLSDSGLLTPRRLVNTKML